VKIIFEREEVLKLRTMNFRFTLFMTVVLVLQFAWVEEAKAQDPRFSQFYAAPSQLNPAMTGVF